MRYLLLTSILSILASLPPAARAGEIASPSGVETAILGIDSHLAEAAKHAGVEASPAADDGEYLRRVTLDLIGRIPTVAEQRAYAAAPSERRRRELVDRLLDGPEFPLHFARVLDDWIQRDRRGDEEFVEWLRTSLASRKPWDALFRTMLVGPWDGEAEKSANKFYTARSKNIDALTSDTSRAFFGVDITCARCHDHPLVADWKQEHYYGLASFFHKPQSAGKKGGASGEKGAENKQDGELTFASKSGGQKTARPMFLSGSLVAIGEPAKGEKGGETLRRRKLVDAALADSTFFRRSAVNRVWAWFFGRGLVEPLDQMHSGNGASVPKLLVALGDDFAAGGYDLRRLVKQIVLSRAYQASYRRAKDADQPGLFRAPLLKPLTPRQYVLSLATAIDPNRFDAATGAERAKRYRELEKQLAALLPELDPTVEGYQAGYREALYLANHEQVQALVGVGDGELKPDALVPQLIGFPTDEARVAAAFEALLGRQPTSGEMQAVLAAWNGGSAKPESVRGRVADLVWALATSAEFRFNH